MSEKKDLEDELIDFEKLRKMTEIGKQFKYFTRKNLDKMKEMMEG